MTQSFEAKFGDPTTVGEDSTDDTVSGTAATIMGQNINDGAANVEQSIPNSRGS